MKEEMIMIHELPNVHEVISYLSAHLSMTSIAKLTEVPYTTLCTLKYKKHGLPENNNCNFNTYKKLYYLYQEVQHMEDQVDESQI